MQDNPILCLEETQAQLSCGIKTLQLICDALDEQTAPVLDCADALSVVCDYFQKTDEHLRNTINAYYSSRHSRE